MMRNSVSMSFLTFFMVMIIATLVNSMNIFFVFFYDDDDDDVSLTSWLRARGCHLSLS